MADKPTVLTTTQIKALETSIYNTLMSSDEMGLGEMGPCLEEAQRIVSEWMQEYNIVEEECVPEIRPSLQQLIDLVQYMGPDWAPMPEIKRATAYIEKETGKAFEYDPEQSAS